MRRSNGLVVLETIWYWPVSVRELLWAYGRYCADLDRRVGLADLWVLAVGILWLGMSKNFLEKNLELQRIRRALL
jgi:hypothetical protein